LKNNNYTFAGKELQLLINSDNSWIYREIKNGYILYKGNFSSWNIELENFISIISDHTLDNQSIVEYISSIQGNFSLVVSTDFRTIASVDHIRSNPLYYLINNDLIITDDVSYLRKQSGEEFNISGPSKIQVLMSGYTLFEDTIYTRIKSFLPGQVILSCCGNTSVYNINSYQVWFNKKYKQNRSLEFLISRFNDVILDVMSNTIDSLDNRQVVIPLTSGYDSRLIASIFRYYNYENVICYTYGTSNNFEAISARELANDLGYKWIFIELRIKEQISFYKSDDFFSYLEYADTPDSVPYYQGLYSVKYLKEKKLIDNNAVFINGNSGDFISGGHVSKFYQHCNNSHLTKSVFDIIISNYYSLWGYKKTLSNIDVITSKINYEHRRIKDIYSTDVDICDFIYYYEFVNRQSKYVIQGQKTFEYYGYDWRLPLWDPKMIAFWAPISNCYKNDQLLYKSTIEKYNYSNVWNKGYQINEYRIPSLLVRYIRIFVKFFIIALTLGNYKIWDRIDRIFFLYFYHVPRMYCSVPYWKIVFSLFKYPRHNVAFDAERYLSRHEKSR